MKRMLALILSLCMVLSMLPAQVFAEETEVTQYPVTWDYDSDHVTVTGETVALEGEDYAVTLTTFPCCDVLDVSIRVGGIYSEACTYVEGTGVLTVPAEAITGDLTIVVLSREKHTEDTKKEEYPGTCMEVAHTDTVVYCVECGEEFSRSTGLGDYAPHEAGTEPGRVEPTCTSSGGTGYYCKYGCGTVIIEEVLEPVPHTPGEPKLEHEWYVTYCNACKIEITRTYSLTQQEAAEKMLKLVNDLRAEHGLNPLQLTQEAIDLATLRAAEIVTDYSHNSAGGYNAGYGENIVMGIHGVENKPVENMFWSWYNSPGHLANMLNENYEEFGFGYLPFEYAGDLYGVQLFSYHKDADKDHKCDRGCDAPVGDHEDRANDGNHTCDYCKSEEILTQCSGGTATCLALAVCEECGQSYGEIDSEVHASEDHTYLKNENGTHTALYACCEVVVETVQHTYTDGSCVCGKEEPTAWDYMGQLYWDLDDSGCLSVTGTGDITEAPWKQYSAQIEKIIIGDGVTAIGADAFADCVNLKTLSFPGSARVESKAFSGCTGLTAITVTAGSGAMYDYDIASGQNLPWYQTEEKNLTVKLAQGVTSVGAFAFCGAENVTGVELPDTLKTIHASAFSGSALTALSIPMGVERIDDHALANLKSIQTLTIPDSVQTLGEYALSASSFRAVELPSGLEAISKGLFKDCTQLSTVMLPDSVQTIGEEAFYNCQTLYGVNVPKALKVIEKNTFRNCTVLNNIYLPEGLTTIGEYAFAGNENLTKLTIPAGVTEIRQNAFNGCKWLDTLVIQSTAFAVQENAFSGCEKLKKVYFAGTEAAWKALLENMGSGNNSLKTASVSCAGDGEDVYNPVQEVQIYFGEERVDGRILLIDLDKTKSITLGYKVFPEDATNPEISWTTNDLNMTDSSREADGRLTLTNMKPGDMTLYAQNFVSGSKEDYTYTTASVRLQFRRVVISGGLNGYLSQDVPTQLTAQILGDGETNRGILWRVENQDGEATIDAKGVIKGTKNGQVIVYAEAADGSGLMASQTFTVSDYAVSISGPDTVASGKSITLKAELIPENLTGTTIKWSLEDPEDHQYVTLNNGKLTAKKGIQEKRNVTVVASAADGQAASAKKTVTVVPVTGSVAIMHGQNTVTGQTVTFDLNRGENTLTFAAVTAPADASKQVTWKVSDTKAAYVAYTANDDGTITLTPTGMTGTVTLTATAADGSGKKATVKVQLVRTAQSIEILNAPKAIRGGSKVTLSTNLAREEGLTDRNVVWSLSQESLPFASINAKGVLTTYAFPGTVTITVCAAVKANPEVEAAQVTIDLLPGAQAAQIRLGDKILTKGEIVYAEVGEEVKLSGSTLPAGADQGGAWKVSGKIADWAPSEDGKTVTLRLSSAGTVTVTFTAGDGSKKNTSVKVQGVERGKELTITAKGDAKELRSGKSLQLTAAVAGATVKKFNWTVSDPSLATVSATGKVKALTVHENKTITVTATAIDGSGLTAEYPLVLKPAKDETLHIFVGGKTVTGTTQYVSLGAEAQTLEVKLYNAVDNTWTDVKDANITVGGKTLQVNDGKIAPTAVGSGTVTAKYSKLTAKVTCKVVRSVEAITITAPGSWLLAGKTMKLTAAVTAAEGAVPTVKKVSWSVDNPDAATISSSGSLKAGKNVTQRTTVTVTAAATDGSGVTQTFQVEIYPQVTAILVQDGITGQILNMCTREYRVGDKLDLAALIYPKDAKQDVTWSISSAKLAELDTENSIITLKSKGTLTIKATVNDGSRKSISVKIKIIEA